jgi:Putative adhesin
VIRGVDVGIGGRAATAPRTGRRLVAIFRAVLAVLAAATGARLLIGLATLSDEHAHSGYPLSGRRLVIEGAGSTGALRISAGQPGRVEVDRVVHHDLQRPQVTQRLDGDRLVLGVRCPTFIVVRCDASYDLRVPAAIDIRVRNPSGDIRLSGVQGAVDLRSDSGSITVQGGSGTARLHSGDGTIRAGGLRAGDVDASSDSGRIAIELAVVPRQVVARSGDGNVQVVVPAGPQAYRVDARSTDGKVTTVLPTDPDSPVRITAASSSGDVVLRRAG